MALADLHITLLKSMIRIRTFEERVNELFVRGQTAGSMLHMSIGEESIAGVCRDETFDVTPYSQAMMKFLLGHPDTQDFGRKFKIAFSGCKDNACALTTLHDLGFIARKRVVGGVEKANWWFGGKGVPFQFVTPKPS